MSSPPVMLISTPVAPAIEMLSSSGLEIACCAASIARFSPRPVPVPISAAPGFRARQRVRPFTAMLFDRLPADFGPGAGAEPARQLFADLDFDIGLVVEERLSIGVDRDELDSAHVLVDHPVQGVAAAPADADDFHPRVLRNGFFEFEDHGSPLGLRRSLAPIS